MALNKLWIHLLVKHSDSKFQSEHFSCNIQTIWGSHYKLRKFEVDSLDCFPGFISEFTFLLLNEKVEKVQQKFYSRLRLKRFWILTFLLKGFWPLNGSLWMHIVHIHSKMLRGAYALAIQGNGHAKATECPSIQKREPLNRRIYWHSERRSEQ